MNTHFSIALVLTVLTGWVAADLPRKAPLTKYRNLWQDSPFTSKPVRDTGPPPPNVLDDYALSGVSPIEGGYRVTIINKKNPDERTYVYSDQPDASHGFKIVSVERKDGDMRGTKVHMMSGTQKGTVSYDEKLLTISAPPNMQNQADERGRGRGRGPTAAPGVAPVPVRPGAQPPVQNQQTSPRAPRPRVVGPANAPQPQTNDASSQQRANKR